MSIIELLNIEAIAQFIKNRNVENLGTATPIFWLDFYCYWRSIGLRNIFIHLLFYFFLKGLEVSIIELLNIEVIAEIFMNLEFFSLSLAFLLTLLLLSLFWLVYTGRFLYTAELFSKKLITSFI